MYLNKLGEEFFYVQRTDLSILDQIQIVHPPLAYKALLKSINIAVTIQSLLYGPNFDNLLLKFARE